MRNDGANAVEPRRIPLFSWRKLPDELGVGAALVILIATVGVINPIFLNQASLVQLVTNSVFFGLLALATVFLLSLGEIDLSIGWNFNLSAVATAELMLFGIDPWLAAAGGVLFGTLLGLFNGVLTVALKLPAIIVTLGTLSMFQGLSLVITQSRAIIPPDVTGSYFTFIRTRLFDVLPMAAIILVVAAIAFHLLLTRFRFGYRVQAIGANTEAARLAGIPVHHVRVAALALMGGTCGLAGAMFIGVRGAIDPTTGGEFLLSAIAAAIIGGTAVSGGFGTVIGAAIGVLIISTIRSGVIFLGIDARWSTFVTGAVIILAVVIDQLLRWQRAKQLALQP
ncbi:MAG: ABC transporter permease [Devosia sp.]